MVYSINKNKKSRRDILLIIIYKFILDILYVGYISKVYAFYHFLSDFQILWYVYSWLLTFIFSIWITSLIAKYESRISIILTYCLYLITFVPFFSFLYGGYDDSYIIWNSLYILIWFIALSFFLQIKNKKTDISLEDFKIFDKYFIWFIVVISVLAVLIVSGVYGGFRFSFNMDYAYEYRAEAANNALPTILSYFYQWARICIPIFITMNIIRKKYCVALVFFIIQMLNFGYDGMRLTVLITMVAIAVPFFFNEKKIKPSKIYMIIVLVLISLMCFSLIEHLLLSSGEIDRVITFRTFFLPNLIGSWFYDFFSKNTPIYFFDSILKIFGKLSQYASVGIDYIISGVYFGDYSGRGNSGLIADAMANLGYIGIFCMPVFINLWLHLLDKISDSLVLGVKIVVAVYFAYCFNNNFFTIILFTNGGIIITMLLSSLNKQIKYQTHLEPLLHKENIKIHFPIRRKVPKE